MRLSNRIIEEVVTEMAGNDAFTVVSNIKKKKNVSEFKIAKDMDWDINYTRNVLYRLYNANLVSFTKKKDKKRGWYIYSWTFKPSNIKFLVTKIRSERLTKLKSWLMREMGGNFFHCGNGCVRFDFESAIDLSFKCPECGTLLNQEDNSGKISDLKDKISRLEETLN